MTIPIKFRFVVATRETTKDFWSKTATGRSLSLYQAPIVELALFPENSSGLSGIYNEVIEKSKEDPAILIFAHDDLYILDFHWMNAIFNGLANFGIVGLAGNKRRVPFQPGWYFIDPTFTPDDRVNLSGVVGHGTSFPPENISVFGNPFQEVKLLDGLFLAASSEILIKNHLRFDDRFKFHFYDLDLCRQAEIRGISMGTIPLSLIHQSGGSFGSEDWKQSYQQYLQKWGQ